VGGSCSLPARPAAPPLQLPCSTSAPASAAAPAGCSQPCATYVPVRHRQAAARCRHSHARPPQLHRSCRAALATVRSAHGRCLSANTSSRPMVDAAALHNQQRQQSEEQEVHLQGSHATAAAAAAAHLRTQHAHVHTPVRAPRPATPRPPPGRGVPAHTHRHRQAPAPYACAPPSAPRVGKAPTGASPSAAATCTRHASCVA
jgi:hypothetical protein